MTAGRIAGRTESAALRLCADLGGDYLAFARARVTAIVAQQAAPGESKAATLARYLMVGERTARRILHAIEGDRRPAPAKPRAEQFKSWRKSA